MRCGLIEKMIVFKNNREAQQPKSVMNNTRQCHTKANCPKEESSVTVFVRSAPAISVERPRRDQKRHMIAGCGIKDGESNRDAIQERRLDAARRKEVAHVKDELILALLHGDRVQQRCIGATIGVGDDSFYQSGSGRGAGRVG